MKGRVDPMDRMPMRSADDRRFLVAVAVLFVLSACAVPAAAAEAPTRPEYVSHLEVICEPGALATQRVMKGARADVTEERLGAATSKFSRTTRIFAGTVKRIAAVPRPRPDRRRLSKWFAFLGHQTLNLRQITKQLKAGHGIKAQRLISRFIHNGNLANNVVLAFGFDYCSFKFSRYG